ncbi:MAG: 2-amino-4-hydroxy-6-hydroxymethyldihydropteridine diphosphokinase [Saprospiraceae bacterium]|nr:2-amino-4-hydroxy-6-hydroxymethyldihydropteridine diphosphokinase [Saprospiraceae bacterium]
MEEAARNNEKLQPVKYHQVFMLLGSNIGDRKHHLTVAKNLIKLNIGRIEKVSSVYNTEPWGVTEHPDYLNQVVEVRTSLTPEAVLGACIDIEEHFDRVRSNVTLPRKMDIDILFYGSLTQSDKNLIIPHPRLHLRRFTLIPLAEIAPDLEHPVFHLSVDVLLKRCSDNSRVVKID